MAGSELSGEEVPEDLTARGNLIASGGEVDFDYSVGVLSVEDLETSVAIIAVAEVDGELLVAVPSEAWHKKVRNRRLPEKALRKAVKVVVPLSSEHDRSAAAGEPTLSVWLGLLAPALEETISFDQAGAELDFPSLPFAGALVAIAGDNFSFVTAESEPQQKEAGAVEARFVAIEEGLRQLTKAMQSSKGPTPMAAASKSRAKPQPAPAPELPPGLDPGVAQQALQAGVSRKALEEMAAVINTPRVGALRHPPRPETTVRFEDYEEDEDSPAEELERNASGGADPISTVVVQMSKILGQMYKDKQKAKDKTLEGILDYAESGSAATSSTGTSRSKAAALRSLQRMLQDNPQLLSAEIEGAMQRDWERAGQLPGLAAGGVTARGWLEHRSRVQNFPSTVRTAWMIAGVLDALRSNKVAEARARCGLALAALDQQAVDRGSWLLAAEVALEPPPPFHSFSLHRAPDPWECPHSLLVDPRWCELFMTKLKDISDFQEKKGKLAAHQGKPSSVESPVPKSEAAPKKAAKGVGKGKQQEKNKETEKGSQPPEAAQS